MVNKEYVTKLAMYAIVHGESEAKKSFSLNDETWNRYKREIKKTFGDISDILSIKEQFSKDELQALASGVRVVSPHNATIDFTGDRVKFGIISDTHIGSRYTNPDNIFAAIDEMKKEKVDFIVHPGDITEGMMGRPGDIYEMTHIGYKAQRDESIRIFSKVEVPLYMISGNHDLSYDTKHGVGVNVVEDICNAIPNAVYLGEGEGDLHIKNITIRLFHGLDGANQYALSYRGQKIIEGITGGEKPHIIFAGHSHKALSFFYRNIHYIETGTLQYQSAWMRGKRLAAHTGFWIVEMCINDEGVAWFQPRWYPIYK
jgi:predicted phosphodiesterase